MLENKVLNRLKFLINLLEDLFVYFWDKVVYEKKQNCFS